MAFPRSDILEPVPDLDAATSEPDWQAALEAEARRRFELLRWVGDDKRRQGLLRDLGAAEPLWFLGTWIWVEDPRRAKDPRGLHPQTPFHFHRQHRNLARRVLTFSEDVAARKPRDAGVSYNVMSCYVQACCCLPGFRGGVTSLTGPKLLDTAVTSDSLLGMAAGILDMLPRWLLPAGGYAIAKHPGRPQIIVPDADESRPPRTISGEKATRTGWHGPRCTSLAFDECARMPSLATMLEGARGATGQMVMLSSSAGPGGLWARIAEDTDEDISSPEVAPHEERAGPGISVVRFRVTDDIRKTPEVLGQLRGSVPDAVFQTQYLDRYDVANVEGAIWPHYRPGDVVLSERAFASLADELDGAPLWEFHDPGLYYGIVWVQELRDPARLVFVDYLSFLHKPVWKIVAEVARRGFYCLPDAAISGQAVAAQGARGRRPDFREIDQAGAQKDARTGETWVSTLRSYGIDVHPIPNDRVADGNRRFGRALEYGAIMLAPRCAERLEAERFGKVLTLSESLTKYRLDVRVLGEDLKAKIAPRKDDASHLADLGRYAVQRIWPKVARANGGTHTWDQARRSWVLPAITKPAPWDEPAQTTVEDIAPWNR